MGEIVPITRVPLTEIISPAFYGLHQMVKSGSHTHFMLKGGRGSTKSSYISTEIINEMMKDPRASAVILRRVGDTLRGSVYEQLQWAIDILGVSRYWKATVSPLQLTYLPTGQRIVFRGTDDVRKLKSTKAPAGTYFKLIWYEELDEFDSMQVVRSATQTFMRGGDKFLVFYSYNPPKAKRSWVNLEAKIERPDRVVHHSDYRAVPPGWLGAAFIAEAEQLKKDNRRAYRHEYLGHELGNGAEVFMNINTRTITDEEIAIFDKQRRGLDFGYGGHPSHYTVCHHDMMRGRLYIFDEYHKYRASYALLAEVINRENPAKRRVIGDSAEPRGIATLSDFGVRIDGAKKGADSVNNGVRYLEDLVEIVIDPKRAPETWREFSNYELEEDGRGGYKAGYPDKDNHSIDAVRYAIEEDVKPSGVYIPKRKERIKS